MEYTTKYYLDFDEEEASNEQVLGLLAAINPDQFEYNYFYYEPGDLDAAFEEPMHWHDHRENMIELSAAIPDVLFTLEGWGEDRGDMWVEYFYNGRCQVGPGDIVFPDPNWNYLKGEE